MEVKDLINKDKTFPYLSYNHPLAIKLLSMKIRRYNEKAKKWGYDTRVSFNFKDGYAVPKPIMKYKETPHGHFWEGLKNGYRNKYIEDLAGQIILESTSMNLKMPYYKRLLKIIYFLTNFF